MDHANGVLHLAMALTSPCPSCWAQMGDRKSTGWLIGFFSEFPILDVTISQDTLDAFDFVPWENRGRRAVGTSHLSARVELYALALYIDY